MKTVIAATVGMAGGGISAGLLVGYWYLATAEADGWESLGAAIFGFFAAIICAPIGCYVALRVARIPQPGITTVKAVFVAVGAFFGLGLLSSILSSLSDASGFVLLAVAASAIPAFVIGRRNGWFTRSLSR